MQYSFVVFILTRTFFLKAISILLDAVREPQYENPTVITVALKVLSNFVLKPSGLSTLNK